MKSFFLVALVALTLFGLGISVFPTETVAMLDFNGYGLHWEILALTLLSLFAFIYAYIQSKYENWIAEVSLIAVAIIIVILVFAAAMDVNRLGPLLPYANYVFGIPMAALAIGTLLMQPRFRQR